MWKFWKFANVFKKSWLRSVKTIVIALAVVALIIIAVGYMFPGKQSVQITGASIGQMIRETCIKLATHKITTMVYCTMEDIPSGKLQALRDFLIGSSEGVFITKVQYVFGLDLDNDFSENNVIVGPDDITITLPEPKLLFDPIIDMDYKIVTKTKILRAMIDGMFNVNVKDQMRLVFKQNAEQFVVENGLKPTKREIIDKIEPFFNKTLGDIIGKRIIFN